MANLNLINAVIQQYFERNKNVSKIQAKELMPEFIKAGVFPADHKNGLPIRIVLRELDKRNALNLIPYVLAERKDKNTNWFFVNVQVESKIEITETVKPKAKVFQAEKKTNKRENSDEHYVIDLCDKILKKVGHRQHRFDFLLGDPGKSGKQTTLPVDVYYPELNLVIEYKEYQHNNAISFFDKPDKLTLSGVSRGEQRRIYDQRRVEVLPEHGIKLIEIPFDLFDCDCKQRIKRNQEGDLKTVIECIKKIYPDLL